MKAKKIIVVFLAMMIVLIAAWFLFLRNPIHVAKMSEAAPHQYGLQVGAAILGWSSHSGQDGYIYMRDVQPSGKNQPLWEFALTPKRQFSEVNRDDLKCEFYGMNDSRGSEVFGTAWDGATILVLEGQVFFARLISNRSTIYVIKLAKQKGEAGRSTMQIEYRIYKI